MTDETTASLVGRLENAIAFDPPVLRKLCRKAADALEAQAVRIAELNAEVLQFHSAYEVAHGQAMANGDACKDAESQRDTALAEVASAKAALHEFGQHKSGCNMARALPFERRSGSVICTCGFDVPPTKSEGVSQDG